MQIEIYTFSHAHEIYADMKWNFFRVKDERPIKTAYHCGRIVVRDGNKIYGIKRLRANAIKIVKEISDCPF